MIEGVAVETREGLIGSVVISKKGRDANKAGVITGWDSRDFALVADGRRRTAANPKKKNMKHLKFTMYRPAGLGVTFPRETKDMDRLIRAGLAEFGGQTGE